jgi:hypothetical protein
MNDVEIIGYTSQGGLKDQAHRFLIQANRRATINPCNKMEDCWRGRGSGAHQATEILMNKLGKFHSCAKGGISESIHEEDVEVDKRRRSMGGRRGG